MSNSYYVVFNNVFNRVHKLSQIKCSLLNKNSLFLKETLCKMRNILLLYEVFVTV